VRERREREQKRRESEREREREKEGGKNILLRKRRFGTLLAEGTCLLRDLEQVRVWEDFLEKENWRKTCDGGGGGAAGSSGVCW